jgi:hypothetical protein
VIEDSLQGITGAAQPDGGKTTLQAGAADLKARLEALERRLVDLS